MNDMAIFTCLWYDNYEKYRHLFMLLIENGVWEMGRSGYCILAGIVLLFACFVQSVSYAEIECDCSQEVCICFIQLGDEGIAVEKIIDLLAEQGYLSTSRVSTYDQPVYEAVCLFQRENNLKESGMVDHQTLTALIWGVQNDQSDESVLVWVPTDGGKKCHRNPLCSGMYDPRKISSAHAEALGIEPCKRCNKP